MDGEPKENPRHALLEEVRRGVNATNQQYQRHPTLFRPDINFQVIPYFGDPLTAEFATFGVNPSANELVRSRWPEANLTVQQLDARLVDYFKNPLVPPVDWFDGYEKALDLLGHSYRTDTVHLDLSPRPTISRSTMAGQLKRKKISKEDYDAFVQRFREMVAADMQWFLLTLTLCRNLKAAIMAGSITNNPSDYFDRFLQARLPPPYALNQRQVFKTDGSGAKTALYDLVGPQLNIPVFFVGCSPSGDKGKIVKEVQRNLDSLRKVLDTACCERFDTEPLISGATQI